MMWFLGGLYCGLIWLVFDKLRLVRLSLPFALLLSAVGPSLIVALVFCAQYCHPLSMNVRVYQKVIPISAQVKQRGRVISVPVVANEPLEAGDILFEIDKAPYERTVEQQTSALATAKQNVSYAEAAVVTAEASIKRAAADLEFMTRERARMEKLVESNTVTREEFEATLARYQQAKSASDQAKAGLAQARVSVDSSRSKVVGVEATLADAQYDLEQTVVRAPTSGYVTNLQLQPGTIVGALVPPVMSFVKDRAEADQGVVVAMIQQKNYFLVQPGQYVEVVLPTYPGQVLTGRVVNTIDITGAGQLTASGNLPTNLGGGAPTQFAVKVRLDDADSLRLPAGASGMGAVYTKHVPVAGLPVMVGLRMMSWLNFL